MIHNIVSVSIIRRNVPLESRSGKRHFISDLLEMIFLLQKWTKADGVLGAFEFRVYG